MAPKAVRFGQMLLVNILGVSGMLPGLHWGDPNAATGGGEGIPKTEKMPPPTQGFAPPPPNQDCDLDQAIVAITSTSIRNTGSASPEQSMRVLTGRAASGTNLALMTR